MPATKHERQPAHRWVMQRGCVQVTDGGLSRGGHGPDRARARGCASRGHPHLRGGRGLHLVRLTSEVGCGGGWACVVGVVMATPLLATRPARGTQRWWVARLVGRPRNPTLTVCVVVRDVAHEAETVGVLALGSVFCWRFVCLSSLRGPGRPPHCVCETPRAGARRRHLHGWFWQHVSWRAVAEPSRCCCWHQGRRCRYPTHRCRSQTVCRHALMAIVHAGAQQVRSLSPHLARGRRVLEAPEGCSEFVARQRQDLID